MLRQIFVRKSSQVPSSQLAAAVESIPPTQPVSVEEKVTVSTMSVGWKQHAKDLLLSMLGVMIMAVLQAALSYMQTQFPDLSTGMSQTGAAFAAIKLLGR